MAQSKDDKGVLNNQENLNELHAPLQIRIVLKKVSVNITYNVHRINKNVMNHQK